MSNKSSSVQLEQKAPQPEKQLTQLPPAPRANLEPSIGYGRLAERSLEGIYHFDIKKREFTLHNARFLELFKFKHEERLTTKSVVMRIIPEDRELVRNAAQKSMQPGVDQGEVVYRVILDDGAQKWMHDRWNVIRDKDGNPTAIEGIVRDDTARKKAEMALEESEKFVKSILKAAPIGIGLINKDKIMWVNDHFAQMLNYPDEGLSAKEKRVIFESDEAYGLMDSMQTRQIREKGTAQFETRLRCCNGKLVDAILGLTPVDAEKPSGETIITALDISERKKTEEALRESEVRLRSVFETVQAAIVIIDPQTHIITDVNPSALKLIAAPREKVIGQVCHQYICPSQEGQCPLTDLGQTHDNTESTLLRANGKSIPIRNYSA